LANIGQADRIGRSEPAHRLDHEVAVGGGGHGHLFFKLAGSGKI